METLTLAEYMNIYGGCYIYGGSTSLTSVFVVSCQFKELFSWYITTKHKMKNEKNEYCMVKLLSSEEYVQVSGGYAPPTAEQLEQLRKIYGPLADIICW